ncbi:MAG: hypothetical protein KGK07_13490 [Chloroflexota bacterium]|nr:hypothetical protein [Chloroflexota bacterium]
MTQQRLRLLIAGVVALIALLGAIVIGLLHDTEPTSVTVALSAALAFLFGTLTNGSGTGSPPKP